MAKKLSYNDLQAKCDRESTVAHIMTIAAMEQADATFRYRDGRDTYIWKVYRLDGCAGGYLVGVFDGFVNRRPSLYYAERLDTAIAGIAERRTSYVDAGGICQAVERFQTERYNRFHKTA
jgi:hypothetical protein